MAKALPESVKWTEVHGAIAAAGSMEGYPFAMKMSQDEVMILLGLHYWWTGVPQAGSNGVNMGLWRKTDTNPPGRTHAEGDSPDMVWSEHHTIKFVTESILASKARDVNFPWPIIFVRPPRFVIVTSTITGVAWSMRLYYILKEIGAVDLAKLMVKDHA